MAWARITALCLLLAATGCGDVEGDAYHDIHVTLGDLEEHADVVAESMLAQEAFAYLPVTATSDVLARAIVFYVHGAYDHGSPTSHRFTTLLEERKIDHMAAVRLGINLATQLGWEARAVVLASLGTVTWLLEVNTQDGRFLLDPYEGRIVTWGGATDEMLNFPDAFTQGAVYQAERAWPSHSVAEMDAAWRTAPSASEQQWRALFATADLAQTYTGIRTVALPVAVDMALQPAWRFGAVDASIRDVEAAFAAPGDLWSHYGLWGGWKSLLGPVNLGHRVTVYNATPGRTYRYDLAVLETDAGLMLASPQGARLGGWRHLAEPTRWSLRVTAETTEFTLDLGLNAASQLSIDAFSFSEVTEPTIP